MSSSFVVVIYIISTVHEFVMPLVQNHITTILRWMGNAFAKCGVVVLGISYTLCVVC